MALKKPKKPSISKAVTVRKVPTPKKVPTPEKQSITKSRTQMYTMGRAISGNKNLDMTLKQFTKLEKRRNRHESIGKPGYELADKAQEIRHNQTSQYRMKKLHKAYKDSSKADRVIILAAFATRSNKEFAKFSLLDKDGKFHRTIGTTLVSNETTLKKRTSRTYTTGLTTSIILDEKFLTKDEKILEELLGEKLSLKGRKEMLNFDKKGKLAIFKTDDGLNKAMRVNLKKVGVAVKSELINIKYNTWLHKLERKNKEKSKEIRKELKKKTLTPKTREKLIAKLEKYRKVSSEERKEKHAKLRERMRYDALKSTACFEGCIELEHSFPEVTDNPGEKTGYLSEVYIY